MLQCVHKAKSYAGGNQDLCNGRVLSKKEIYQTHRYYTATKIKLAAAEHSTCPDLYIWGQTRCSHSAGRRKTNNGVLEITSVSRFRGLLTAVNVDVRPLRGWI